MKSIFDKGLLESFDNESYREKLVTISQDTLVTKCPMSKWPDFSRIIISYVPDKKLIELDSLERYIYSMKDFEVFSENVIEMIMTDLVDVYQPRYIEIKTKSTPVRSQRIETFVNHIGESFSIDRSSIKTRFYNDEF